MMDTQRDAVRRVLYITLVLNVVVSVAKIAVGAASGMLAITADGFHSLIDGSSNVIALVGIRMAAKPADEDHPYGHHRFETLAALVIGVLLLFTAWEIIGGAIEKLFGGAEDVEMSPLTLIVLFGTLAVNLFVSRYERREGERLKSEVLLADAANTGADVFVTLSVIISSVVVMLTGWTWVDPIASLVVVALVVRAGLQVLRQTGGVLVDTAPYGSDELSALLADVPGVRRVVRARSRGTTEAAFVDVDVEVAPEMTAEHSAVIADAIRAQFDEALEGVLEVDVHFTPCTTGTPDYGLMVRAHADALGLSTHDVRVQQGDNGLVLEMHVEVSPNQTLDEAHDEVTRLEQAIMAHSAAIVEVISHIEPVTSAAVVVDDGDADDAAALLTQATRLLEMAYPDVEWCDMRMMPHEEGYALTARARMQALTSVEDAHAIAEGAEVMLRASLDRLLRVTIHTEPDISH